MSSDKPDSSDSTVNTATKAQQPPKENRLEGAHHIDHVDPELYFNWKTALIPIAVGLIIWLIPRPDTLSAQAWEMLAIFIATIVAIIVKVMPIGAICLVAMGIAGITNLTPIKPDDGQVGLLSGFANSTIWLIGIAMFLSRAVIKTGLGRRVALLLINKFGKKTIGVAYAFVLAELVLGPVIPSSSARGAGILYPVVRSVSSSYGSEPGPTARKAGAFLILVLAQADAVVSAMFLTAMAGNPMVQGFAAKQGIEISWGTWFIGAIVPGIVALIVLPLFIYKIYPPELKDTPETAEYARHELKEMGPMSLAEKILTADFVLLLFLWTVGDMVFGINATVSAIIGLVILMFASIMKWDDIIGEKSAWDTLFWFAILVMLANALEGYGVVEWISGLITDAIGGLSWPVGLIVLVLVFFYTRYMFASATAHGAAMYTAFLVAALAIGAPPLAAAMTLAITMNLSMGLTQYSGGIGPALFASGYNSTGQWWGVAFATSIVSLIIWIAVGGAWFSVLGWL